jgi:imidazolonepropionase-like amidohydrolase
MHGLVIRGGTIVDASGNDRYSGDVAIDDGRITAVGGQESSCEPDRDASKRSTFATDCPDGAVSRARRSTQSQRLPAMT